MSYEWTRWMRFEELFEVNRIERTIHAEKTVEVFGKKFKKGDLVSKSLKSYKDEQPNFLDVWVWRGSRVEVIVKNRLFSEETYRIKRIYL